MPDCEGTKKCTPLVLLESRVEQLENGRKRDEEFRKTYYQDRDARIDRDARLDEQIKGMDEKLDTLLSWQKSEVTKPKSFLERIKGNAIWFILEAILVFLIAKIGLTA